MEKEKTTIQKLNDFAQKTHRTIELTEQAYPSNALHPVTYHRRLVYIPESGLGNTYFACFGDSRRLDKQAIYSGVFFSVPLPKSLKICIRRKDILDKMSLFSKKKGYKTGNVDFDSQVVFEEFDGIGTSKIFKSSKVQKLILKAFAFDLRLRIGVNMMNMDYVPGLKGESHFGIYTMQDWFIDSSKIEILYDLAEQLKKLTIRVEEEDLVAQY